jgi:hypothetical protein
LAIVTLSWISNSICGSIDEGVSLVEIWAVLESLDSEIWKRWSIVWEAVTLNYTPSVLAIVTSSWISNSFGGSVDEGESLVEIWAVLELLDSEVWKRWSIVWEVVTLN